MKSGSFDKGRKDAFTVFNLQRRPDEALVAASIAGTVGWIILCF
jgi:hypothetical protein